MKTAIQNFPSFCKILVLFLIYFRRNHPSFHDGICFRWQMGYDFLVKHNIALPFILLANIQMGFY